MSLYKVTANTFNKDKNGYMQEVVIVEANGFIDSKEKAKAKIENYMNLYNSQLIKP